jgi:hypothetical protein
MDHVRQKAKLRSVVLQLQMSSARPFIAACRPPSRCRWLSPLSAEQCQSAHDGVAALERHLCEAHADRRGSVCTIHLFPMRGLRLVLREPPREAVASARMRMRRRPLPVLQMPLKVTMRRGCQPAS